MARVVVIAPHPDDAELGVGGTILKHVQSGDIVEVIILCTKNFRNIPGEDIKQLQGVASIENAKTARSILGYNKLHLCELSDETLDKQISLILDAIEPIVNVIQPDIMYVTHFGDNNQDHRAAYQAAQILARPSIENPISKLICYETPSGTDQTPHSRADIFTPNLYNTLTLDQINIKIKAFECYESEVREPPHPRNSHGILTYAKYRGIQCGSEYAEALCVMRDIKR